MANSGIKTAKVKLGLVYQVGQGVPQDWAKAWQFYQNAGEIGKVYKKRLEAEANGILHNQNSLPAAREQAYQIVEYAANTEPAGDPAQKWMEYRYRLGDGVAIDAAQADAWQQRYDGIENPSKPLGTSRQGDRQGDGRP